MNNQIMTGIFNKNRQDYHEPKHELNVYGDLIEGGDEGDDD